MFNIKRKFLKKFKHNKIKYYKNLYSFMGMIKKKY